MRVEYVIVPARKPNGPFARTHTAFDRDERLNGAHNGFLFEGGIADQFHAALRLRLFARSSFTRVATYCIKVNGGLELSAVCLASLCVSLSKTTLIRGMAECTVSVRTCARVCGILEALWNSASYIAITIVARSVTTIVCRHGGTLRQRAVVESADLFRSAGNQR